MPTKLKPATGRYWVYDRKVSDLTKFSAVNPRYWVVDSTTNLDVDAFESKVAARGTADLLNLQERA
jgi:hypothetical protein